MSPWVIFDRIVLMNLKIKSCFQETLPFSCSGFFSGKGFIFDSSCIMEFAYNIFLFKGVRSLKNGIILELPVHGTTECGQHCLRKIFCAGFNLKKNAKRNKINCQLTISKDHKFEKNSSAEESDWNFYALVGERQVSLI